MTASVPTRSSTLSGQAVWEKSTELGALAALDLLQQAYSQRDTMIHDLMADPPWDQIKDRPRYQQLMTQMAFPPPPDPSRSSK